MSDLQKLYAIHDLDTGLVKVGISIDPIRRLSQIRSKEKRPNLKILVVQEVVSAADSEAELLRRFAEYRVVSEWFDLTPEQIAALEQTFDGVKLSGSQSNTYNERLAVPAIINGVKEAMQRESLTQQVLADRAGVPQPSVARVLTGKRGKMSTDLLKMLEALNLEIVVRPKGKGNE